MRKKSMVMLGIASTMVLFASGCAGGGTAASPGDANEDFPEIHLIIQSNVAPADTSSVYYEEWAKAVEEASGGKITYEMSYSGAIAPITDVPSALSSGIIDVGNPVPDYDPAQFPKWASLLGLENSGFQARTPLSDTLVGAAANGALGFNEELIEEMHNAGIHPILPRYYQTGGANLMCSSPVDTLAGTQGKSVRIANESQALAVEALGMTPVSLPFSETYEALQRGTVDCAIFAVGTAAEVSLEEVATHWVLDPEVAFTGNVSPYAIALSTWEQLGPNGQRVAMEAAFDVLMRNDLIDRFELNSKNVAEAEEMGVTLHEFDSTARDALKKHYASETDSAVNRAEAAGVSDPEGWVQSYLDAQKEWTTTIEEMGYVDEPGASWATYGTSGYELDPSAFMDKFYTEFIKPQLGKE